MLHTLSVRVDPNCLTFLNQPQYKRDLSTRQNTFIERVNELHTAVKQLESQTSTKLTPKAEKEIRRGTFYALTKSLEEKFITEQTITLSDVQNVLNKEFCISDKPTIDFIIMSLLEPHSLPFALSTLAYSVLTDNSIWSNDSMESDSAFKYTLKAEFDLIQKNILFKMRLALKSINFSQSSPQGSAQIQFMLNQQKQIKLLPLKMEFKFVDKKEYKQFKKELSRDFQAWIFLHKTHWQIADLWVIPTLLSCLFGLIAMMSLFALSLTPLSPLLLPPLGLALGLCLASVMHTFVYINTKKEEKKLQRPIHLFNRKPIQTVTFFNPHSARTAMANEYNEHGHPAACIS